MTEHELNALDAMASKIALRFNVDKETEVLPRLVAEVRRLRAELGMAYGHDYAKANPTYTGPCPLCQRGYA